MRLKRLKEQVGLGRPKGSTWRVRIIAQGWSANRRYYSQAVLERSAGLWEGRPVALYRVAADGSAEHLLRSARAALEGPGGNVAGFTANCVYETQGEVGPGIYADLHLTNSEVRELALRATEAAVECPLGLSIDAQGRGQVGHAEGLRGFLVEEIAEVLETTLVSNPAAGGRLVRLIASAGNKSKEQGMKLQRFLERRLRRMNGQADGVPGLTPAALCEQVAAQLAEMDADKTMLSLVMDFLQAGKVEEATMALEKLLAAVPGGEGEDKPEAPKPKADKPTAPTALVSESVGAASGDLQAVTQQLARMQEAVQAQAETQRTWQCQQMLRESLATSQLPEAVQSYLRKQFASRHFEAVELAEAIADARSMLAKSLPAAGVQTGAQVQVGIGRYERLAAAVDCMWAGAIPEALKESEAHKQVMRGRAPRIREIAVEWYDDPTCSGRSGANAVLCEATTADLPNILGTSMNRRIADLFATRTRDYERWVKLVPDVQDFKIQEILIEGALGALPVVSQGDGQGTATYSYGTIGSDDKVTAAIAKYGRLYGLTREMLKNDDMRWLKRLPELIVDAAMLTEKQLVLRALVGNLGGSGINTDLAYTGQPIYSNAHNNLGATAFGYDSLCDALLKKRNTRQRGAKTALTANINTSTTTIPVLSTAGFGANENFYIDAELFTIVTVDSATQFTVATRSGGASHSSGAAVRQLLDQIRLSKHTLVVPSGKVQVAAEVLAAILKPDTANNNGSALPFLAKDIELQDYHESLLGGNANNWYAPVAADEGHFMELAHMDGVRIPQVLVAEGQEHYNMLRADQTDYKVRFEVYVKVIQPDGSTGYFS